MNSNNNNNNNDSERKKTFFTGVDVQMQKAASQRRPMSSMQHTPQDNFDFSEEKGKKYKKVISHIHLLTTYIYSVINFMKKYYSLHHMMTIITPLMKYITLIHQYIQELHLLNVFFRMTKLKKPFKLYVLTFLKHIGTTRRWYMYITIWKTSVH